MASEKLINPAPIVKKLADRCLVAKGVECSILGEVIDLLRAAPAANAEAGVHCKDCKHYMDHPAAKRMCCYVHLLTPFFMPEDGFCSYGERKNNE